MVSIDVTADAAGCVKLLDAELLKRMTLAVEYLKSTVQRNISTPSSPNRSKPGEYPHADKGRLRNEILGYVLDGGRRGIVGTNYKVGMWLENEVKGGTVIRPKTAKALRWVGAGGQVFFRRSVVQGPIVGRQFLSRTASEEQANVARFFTG